MAKKEKNKKSKSKIRSIKYEEKLQVDASFEELVKALITPKKPKEKK